MWHLLDVADGRLVAAPAIDETLGDVPVPEEVKEHEKTEKFILGGGVFVATRGTSAAVFDAADGRLLHHQEFPAPPIPDRADLEQDGLDSHLVAVAAEDGSSYPLGPSLSGTQNDRYDKAWVLVRALSGGITVSMPGYMDSIKTAFTVVFAPPEENQESQE